MEIKKVSELQSPELTLIQTDYIVEEILNEVGAPLLGRPQYLLVQFNDDYSGHAQVWGLNSPNLDTNAFRYR